jgi:hypothetical protein
VLLNFFVPFFSTRCISVCSKPLRFGTQVPNMMCTQMVQNLKIVYFKKFAPKVVNLVGHKEKNFFFHFKHYNLTICVVNFYETFCTCSLCSLRQDLTILKCKINTFFSFGLLELKMAILKCFLKEKAFVLRS